MRILILNLLILVIVVGGHPGGRPTSPGDPRGLLPAESGAGHPRRRQGPLTRAEIDKILLLQKEHELELSEEFLFRYAKAAAAAALPGQAFEAVVKYLTAVGQDGPHYVEALELMSQAQDEIAGRERCRKPPRPLVAPEQQKTPLDHGGKSETILPRACGLWEWDSSAFFLNGNGPRRESLSSGGSGPQRPG